MIMVRRECLVGFALAIIMASSVVVTHAEERAQPTGADRVDELMLRYNLHPAFAKLGRGVANFLGGWLEIPLNIQKGYTEQDTGPSLFTGAAVGFFKGTIRTFVGLYETVSFFFPYPEDFAPILPTIEYFKREPKRKPLLLE